MVNILVRWFNRNFSDPQAIVLFLMLVFGFGFIIILGGYMAPVFVAVVFAYLLEWPVQAFMKYKMSRTLSSSLVFLLFIGVFTLIFLVLLPLLGKQISNFFANVPEMLSKGQAAMALLPEKYPDLFSTQQIDDLNKMIRDEIGKLGQSIVSLSFSSIVGLVAVLVYLFLVPFMVFFFLKDKHSILQWCLKFLPKERHMANRVWEEVNEQIGNYIRGKIVEIIIVGSISFVVFTTMGLQYSLMLGLLVGFSVLIPYIGATVVTIPVALVAYFQFGFSEWFGWILLAYTIIQAIDGNVIVPVLFSEAVNLHPVAIIVAVLFFGGVWGFWGIFFAIPLATLVQAVMSAWEDAKMVDA
ncbi:MAG: AI-2E family transporter [Pseudomonadota bacterium]